MWFAISSLLLGLYGSELSAEDSKPAMRPISDAESVLAVYREESMSVPSRNRFMAMPRMRI